MSVKQGKNTAEGPRMNGLSEFRGEHFWFCGWETLKNLAAKWMYLRWTYIKKKQRAHSAQTCARARTTRQFWASFPVGSPDSAQNRVFTACGYHQPPRRHLPWRRRGPTPKPHNFVPPKILNLRVAFFFFFLRKLASLLLLRAMMGSRVAAALLRRGRDQASSLMAARLPRGAPAPSPAAPRVGSGSVCGCGGGGGLLTGSRSTGSVFSASRLASFHAFRSIGSKVRSLLCFSPHSASLGWSWTRDDTLTLEGSGLWICGQPSVSVTQWRDRFLSGMERRTCC